MTSTVTNQGQTIVSFCGNSGETWHIPPGHAITMMTVELTDNEKAAPTKFEAEWATSEMYIWVALDAP